jgi:RimJ/RimL family protein N-acetyltransferase
VSGRAYRLVRVPPSDTELAWLDAECLPEDTAYPKAGAVWWLVKGPGGEPVAFGGIKYWAPDQSGFLCRAGVVRGHRGQGLQCRLIRARVRYARDAGWRGVYTYTLPSNPASGNNLIKCGFRQFLPSYAWGGQEAIYWWLPLRPGDQP